MGRFSQLDAESSVPWARSQGVASATQREGQITGQVGAE